jgi:hypothetical protein
MNSPDKSGSPPNIIRWAIIGCIAWIISGLTLIVTTYSSLRRPLDLGGTLTERITSTEDQAKQQQFNVLLLRVIDNRIAAVKALQRRVIFFATGTVAVGVLTAWFLFRVYRSLRRDVTYEMV